MFKAAQVLWRCAVAVYGTCVALLGRMVLPILVSAFCGAFSQGIGWYRAPCIPPLDGALVVWLGLLCWLLDCHQ